MIRNPIAKFIYAVCMIFTLLMGGIVGNACGATAYFKDGKLTTQKLFIDWSEYSLKEARIMANTICQKNDEALKRAGLEGRCLWVAFQWMFYYESKGYKTRIGRGIYKHNSNHKGEGHAWCEYYDGKQWLIYDKSVGILNFPMKSCRQYYTTIYSYTTYRLKRENNAYCIR